MSSVRRYESITAVILQDDVQAVERLLRLNEETANVREPDRPYLFFGGRSVLRFVRDDPEFQERFLLSSVT